MYIPSRQISAVTWSWSKKIYFPKIYQQGQACNIIKKDFLVQVFPMNSAKYFAKYLRTAFLLNTCERLLLKHCSQGTTNKSEIIMHQLLFQPDFWRLRVKLVKSFSQIFSRLKILIDLRQEMLPPAAFFIPTRQAITFLKSITILSFLPKHRFYSRQVQEMKIIRIKLP